VEKRWRGLGGGLGGLVLYIAFRLRIEFILKVCVG
jgi:hypothetical protein